VVTKAGLTVCDEVCQLLDHKGWSFSPAKLSIIK